MARPPVRIERGLIPLLDIFALLVGTCVVLLIRADLDPAPREETGWDGARLVVACRVDGRCLYQGEVLFEEHEVREEAEARLLSRLAQEPSARIVLKLPPPEEAGSRFLYTDFQLLQKRWGRERLEVVP